MNGVKNYYNNSINMIKRDLHDCENSAKKEITFKTNNKNGVKNIDLASLRKDLV